MFILFIFLSELHLSNLEFFILSAGTMGESIMNDRGLRRFDIFDGGDGCWLCFVEIIVGFMMGVLVDMGG